MIKAKNDSFIIHIGQLWQGPEGGTVQEDFEQSLTFEPAEIKVKSPVSGHLLLAKSKGEVIAVISDLHVKVELSCQKCLTTYNYDVEIPGTERVFHSEKPEDDTDIEGIFLINMKDLTIDLYEMLRQEIILHFPLNSVCSKGCKGLCPRCGANWNKKTCDCEKTGKSEDNKPFKDLKQLMQ